MSCTSLHPPSHAARGWQEQFLHGCFLPAPPAQRKRMGMESSLHHQDLVWHGLLGSVTSWGRETHRLTRSYHNLCLPLPACSNLSQSLHTLVMVSGYVPQQWPPPYLQPELFYLLQHRGLLVPAAREKPVTNSLRIPIFLHSLQWRQFLLQRAKRPHHNQVTSGLPGSVLLWEDEEAPPSEQSPLPAPWALPVR